MKKKPDTIKERIAVVETHVETLIEDMKENKNINKFQIKLIIGVIVTVLVTNIDKLPTLFNILSNTTAFAGS